MESTTKVSAASYPNLSELVMQREINGPHFKKFRSNSYPENAPIISDVHFQHNMSSHITFIEKLKLKRKLKKHNGCVNTIQWNDSGTLLVTGSDDCKLCVWSSPNYNLKVTIPSAHARNIFCARFVPGSNDNQIVSCSMDGVLAITDVNKKESKVIASYDLMAHRVAFLPGSSSVFFSTHQDGRVRYFDLRENNTTQNVVIKLKNDRDLISANGMAFSPYGADPCKFALGGQDHLVRLYDIRQTFKNSSNGRITDSITSEPIRQFFPEDFKQTHLKNKYSGIAITGIDFNAKNELLVNYSQDDVYIFDASDSAHNIPVVNEYKQVFKGRRNVQTFLKEASFFGNDEFIATGSDCGSVYIWEKCSGNLVHCFTGDSRVVNGVAPHPCQLPILAICGIDSDAKIFEPCSENTVDKEFMDKMSKRNGEQPSEMRGLDILTLLRLLTGRDFLVEEEEEDDEDFHDESEEEEEHVEQFSKVAALAKLGVAVDIRQRADQLLGNNNFREASALYSEAIDELNFGTDDAETLQLIQEEQLLCKVNKATCYMKLENYDLVIFLCSDVLEQKSNFAALKMRGTAYFHSEDYDSAKEDLLNALQINANDQEVIQLLEEIQKKQEL